MELPIIQGPRAADPDVYVRAIKRASAELAPTFSERIDLEGATVFRNPDRRLIWDANCAFDVRVPDDRTARDVYEEIQSAFGEAGLQCRVWVSSDREFEDEFARLLESAGYAPHLVQIMAMDQAQGIEKRREDVQIIPARSAISLYRKLRQVCCSAEYGDAVGAEMAACQVDMLDDPRLDMLVLRAEGRAVATAGVFAAGEIGVLWDVATHPEYQRHGYMRTLLHHVLDLCARSQFKSVILECAAENDPAVALYESIGMMRTAAFRVYRPAPQPAQGVSVDE